MNCLNQQCGKMTFEATSLREVPETFYNSNLWLNLEAPSRPKPKAGSDVCCRWIGCARISQTQDLSEALRVPNVEVRNGTVTSFAVGVIETIGYRQQASRHER